MPLAEESTDPLSLHKRLSDAQERLIGAATDEDKSTLWQDVTREARAIADILRVRDGPVDNHTVLGKTTLPQTLKTLYSLALGTSVTPEISFTAPLLEILRVAANLCMDHDENRSLLLDAGLPQSLVSLLEGYVDSAPSPPHSRPYSLPTAHIKLIRTAMGVLLNASVGYEPVKYRLISLEAAVTVLKLSTAIYPTACWLDFPALDNIEDLEEAWNLRISLSSWAWRIVLELKDVKDETLQIFTTDVLPILVPPLVAFTTQDTNIIPEQLTTSPVLQSLLQADFENLEESCTILESLSLDAEDVRLSLARGYQFSAEHQGVPCFGYILDFLEKGAIPPFWNVMPASFDAKRKEKAFNMCKAALIKSVVEVVGEERNEHILWDDSELDTPGGEFVTRMVQWLKKFVVDMESSDGAFSHRTDLVICASLSLGNLARREKNASVLLSPPHSLANVLSSVHLLSPDSDIKVKHGVLGLLKHLAQASFQSPAIQAFLTQADTVRRISECGIWDQKADAMAEVVQLSAIGVVKHMCNANIANTFALVLPSTQDVPTPQTGLSQILSLVKRSDSIPIKSEGTRVLVNVIKSLWSNDVIGASSPNRFQPSADRAEDDERQRQDAIRTVLTMPCASALASLVARSGKYPLLVNEGVVALTLLSTQKSGAPLALTAILSPVLFEPPPIEPPSASTSVATEVSSPTIATPSSRGQIPVKRTALDMMIAVIKNFHDPVNFQVEVRINVCSLLIQLGKNCSEEEGFNQVKGTMLPHLKELSETLGDASGMDATLAKAVGRALKTWE
ncbi:hypothetical protein E1B28_008774 [Marasmius oreades]|uniref:ARM repeat superfamily protein n=1 Tax=Marasmius oreades TaxID=181124 RepID=A0A9P7USG3_9AGAR|nr:uncharacterized protein E1B28_008774 [Marasmius oreades]KAG7092418.1 hypothetical protein E1B28_008774 [Marasmius oreades]